MVDEAFDPRIETRRPLVRFTRMHLPVAPPDVMASLVETSFLESLWPVPTKLWLLKGSERYAELEGPCSCLLNQSKLESETVGCPMRVLGAGLRAVAAFSDRDYARTVAGVRYAAKAATLKRALKIALQQGAAGVIVCCKTPEGMDSRFFPVEVDSREQP